MTAAFPTPGQLLGTPWRRRGPWCAGGGPLYDTEGWKLYVSTTVQTHVPVLEALVPVLRRVPHYKYIADDHHLRALNAGTFGYSQIGKCVVLYLPAIDECLVVDTIHALGPFRGTGPRVPFANRFGDDMPLSYRYGSYDGDAIRPAGVEVPDPRQVPGAAVPYGVDDALARFVVRDEPDLELRSLLLRFPPFEALQQQGKGGIFRALDLDATSYREVVVKVGYPRGQVQPDGTDGRDMVRREAAFYHTLGRLGLTDVAPALRDVHIGRHVAIVLEDVRGPTLLELLLAGRLTVPHLKACLRILGELHAAGLYLGDAKLANFVLRESDRTVVAVDFETAGIAGVDPVLPVRTFQLVNPAPPTVWDADRQHLLASVLFPYEDGRYDLEDRRIDLRTAAGHEYEQEVRRWAAARLLRALRTGSV